MLGDFFKNKHQYIQSPYVLICHNSDERMPGEFSHFLEDSKILAWFAQNIEEYSHAKLINLPIGLANRYWGHGSIDSIKQVRSIIKEIPRDRLVYLNISIDTYPRERMWIYQTFKDKPYCLSSLPKSFDEYLKDLASS